VIIFKSLLNLFESNFTLILFNFYHHQLEHQNLYLPIVIFQSMYCYLETQIYFHFLRISFPHINHQLIIL